MQLRSMLCVHADKKHNTYCIRGAEKESYTRVACSSTATYDICGIHINSLLRQIFNRADKVIICCYDQGSLPKLSMLCTFLLFCAQNQLYSTYNEHVHDFVHERQHHVRPSARLCWRDHQQRNCNAHLSRQLSSAPLYHSSHSIASHKQPKDRKSTRLNSSH